MPFPITSMSDIVSVTMENRKAKMAAAIMRDSALAKRFNPPPQPWYKRTWRRIVNAWPLQWKRDDA